MARRLSVMFLIVIVVRLLWTNYFEAINGAKLNNTISLQESEEAVIVPELKTSSDEEVEGEVVDAPVLKPDNNILAISDCVGVLYIPALGMTQYTFQSNQTEGELAGDWLNKSVTLREDGAYAIEESHSGSICFDPYAGSNSSHPIIYGHNMKNGTMFGSLKKLLSQDLVDSDPYVYFYTGDMVYKYQIFSCYVGTTDDFTYNVQTGAGFDVEAAKAASVIESDNEGTQPSISLVTCNGIAGGNGRLFVHAALVEYGLQK